MRTRFAASTTAAGTSGPGVLLQAAFNPLIGPPQQHGRNPKTSSESSLAETVAEMGSVLVD